MESLEQKEPEKLPPEQEPVESLTTEEPPKEEKIQNDAPQPEELQEGKKASDSSGKSQEPPLSAESTSNVSIEGTPKDK